MKTRSIKAKEIVKKNYVIDAKGIIIGKLAVRVAKVFLGKSKVSSARYVPIFDNVYVKNASMVEVVPSRYEKKYYWHSQYPGGFKNATFEKLRKNNPKKLIQKSVWGMLPKNRLGRAMLEQLNVYPDDRLPELEYITINI